MKKLEIGYRKAFVAYIDVLGFKSMLNKDVSGLESYFNTILDIVGPMKLVARQVDKVDLEVKLISDSIILAIFSEDWRCLKTLFVLVCNIQMRLAAKGIWVRGGISYGDFFMNVDHDVTVGSALSRAYELETKFAKFPRVILDQGIFDLVDPKIDKRDFIEEFLAEAHPAVKNAIHLDSDLHINTNWIGWACSAHVGDPDWFHALMVGTYDGLRKCIYEKTEFLDKYNWLAQFVWMTFQYPYHLQHPVQQMGKKFGRLF